MTQLDLFKIWAEEAKEALQAKKSGRVLDLWKVVAERKVPALLIEILSKENIKYSETENETEC